MCDLIGISPEFIWGTFTRLLGLLLAWAIGQLYFQAPLLAGKNGLVPIKFKLGQIKRDFSFWGRIFYFPSLFWISHSDGMMRFLILSGVGAGIYIFCGGAYLWLAFLYCYLVYLSFDLLVGLSFPWDSMLFEVCLLSIFLPDLPLLPNWESITTPHPILIFLYQWLLFRVLFGFGKMKFAKFNWKDSGYFRGFLHTVPLPSKVAKILHNAPDFVFLVILWIAFFVEIIIPFFVFVPGIMTVLAAVSIIGLMIGIQLVSNFGFFNILTILVAFTLFDSSTFIWSDWHFDVKDPFEWFMSCLLIFYLVTGFVNLIFNSWCSFTWMHWPSALHLQSYFSIKLLQLLRACSRWRIVHAYGVFPPKGQPAMKLVPIIEGSNDGIDWQPYHYKYTLSHSEDHYHFVAPYHPRIDHGFFYFNFGITDNNFNNMLVGSCSPYEFAGRGGIDSMLQAILEGRENVTKNFKFAPFSEKEPPKWLRVGQYWFEPKNKKERKSKKDYWQIHLAEIHKMPRKLEADFDLKKGSFPELFHWDFHFWRMRTKAAKDWKKWAGISNFENATTVIGKALEVDSDYFWKEFPELLQLKSANWKNIKEHTRNWEAKTDFEFRQKINRYWNQWRIVLSLRCMSIYLERSENPLADANFWTYGMLLNFVMMQGKEAVQKIWENPNELRAFEEKLKSKNSYQLEKGFYIETVFQLEMVIQQCRKLRWAMRAAPPESNPILPGFARLLPFLHKTFEEEGFDAWPDMNYEASNGKWTISNRKNITPENAPLHLKNTYFFPHLNQN